MILLQDQTGCLEIEKCIDPMTISTIILDDGIGGTFTQEACACTDGLFLDWETKTCISANCPWPTLGCGSEENCHYIPGIGFGCIACNDQTQYELGIGCINIDACVASSGLEYSTIDE
jgi:hypothetical protein